MNLPLSLFLSPTRPLQAEARLAAKRAARAEAREIRMRELERQQKEVKKHTITVSLISGWNLALVLLNVFICQNMIGINFYVHIVTIYPFIHLVIYLSICIELTPDLSINQIYVEIF